MQPSDWKPNPKNYKLVSLPIRLNVTPLLAELDAHPELWNKDRTRTAYSDSPHRELDDICIRYAPPDPSGQFNPREPHDFVWYPAVNKLPSIWALFDQLIAHLKPMRFGGVLITRIPPGKRCYPHVDGFWHAECHEKCAVQLRSHPDQFFHVQDEKLSAAPGECYLFENRVPHWVNNPSPVERITMIVCFRREQ